MAIFISKRGKGAEKIEKSNFEKEGDLQKYICENPDSIPLFEIKEDIKLLILSREFSVESGKIDALGIDEDGDIYIIETKLYKNKDKRLVLAQVLDYGASLWYSYGNFDDFIRDIDNELNTNLKTNFYQKVKEFFNFEDEEISVLIENMKNNLREGNFKFVILMDKIPPQLKDLIVFINKNSRFDIYIVEMEYYKFNEYEIVIPKLFGTEIKKDISSNRNKIKWDEETFFNDAKKELNDEEFKILKDIYNFTKDIGIIAWGRGAKHPTFGMKLKNSDFKKNIFTVSSEGRASMNIGNVYTLSPKIAEWLADEVKKIGIEVNKERLESSFPQFDIVKLKDQQIKTFKQIITELCQKLERI